MSPLRVRLREIREAQSLSQQQLSDLADVRQATISELESGKRQRVDLSILDRLADALDVEPCELIVRTERRRRAK